MALTQVSVSSDVGSHHWSFCPGHAVVLCPLRGGESCGRAPWVLLLPASAVDPWDGKSSIAGAASQCSKVPLKLVG